jgi:hypothetical protein
LHCCRLFTNQGCALHGWGCLAYHAVPHTTCREACGFASHPTCRLLCTAVTFSVIKHAMCHTPLLCLSTHHGFPQTVWMASDQEVKSEGVQHCQAHEHSQFLPSRGASSARSSQPDCSMRHIICMMPVTALANLIHHCAACTLVVALSCHALPHTHSHIHTLHLVSSGLRLQGVYIKTSS